MEAREIAWLLQDLRVKEGFCLTAAAREPLLASMPGTPEEFAITVMSAEGLDPFLDKRLYRALLETVQQAFERSADRDT